MMIQKSTNKGVQIFRESDAEERHYREFKRKNIIRLLLTYVTPLILLTIFFIYQYDAIVSESRRLHLKSIAENQANTLDLFLSERLINISNLIDDPKFPIPPPAEILRGNLEKLGRISPTFVDIGYFDSSGTQVSYAGPFPSLENRNYSSASWYQDLKEQITPHIITDIYLGFRQRPHFTIAVSRIISNQFVVLRATLDPERMYEYITSLEGSHEVFTSIVNKAGYYQLVTSHIGTPLETSSIVPPADPKLGVDDVKIEGLSFCYGYSWLKNADWALIVQFAAPTGQGWLSGLRLRMLLISSIFFILIFLIIVHRAKRLVELQKESDKTRAQLEHAAKLASVGELAAGIAHEINNPLAVINEEAGLIKDMLNPEFNMEMTPEDLKSRLSIIQDSVFRCRDITHKLLAFVRRSEIDLKDHDIHQLIDEVADGLLGQELTVSNIEIIKNYSQNLPALLTDRNQLEQVILNIMKNAMDALGDKPGRIVIDTSQDEHNVNIAITDTGIGMSPEQLDKIFVPFHTTKDVGKGTGLGLSVSYGIIKSLGGTIEVQSQLGRGSTFIVVLPKNQPHKRLRMGI